MTPDWDPTDVTEEELWAMVHRTAAERDEQRARANRAEAALHCTCSPEWGRHRWCPAHGNRTHPAEATLARVRALKDRDNPYLGHQRCIPVEWLNKALDVPSSTPEPAEELRRLTQLSEEAEGGYR